MLRLLTRPRTLSKGCLIHPWCREMKEAVGGYQRPLLPLAARPHGRPRVAEQIVASPRQRSAHQADQRERRGGHRRPGLGARPQTEMVTRHGDVG